MRAGGLGRAGGVLGPGCWGPGPCKNLLPWNNLLPCNNLLLEGPDGAARKDLYSSVSIYEGSDGPSLSTSSPVYPSPIDFSGHDGPPRRIEGPPCCDYLKDTSP